VVELGMLTVTSQTFTHGPYTISLDFGCVSIVNNANMQFVTEGMEFDAVMNYLRNEGFIS
jgi:hypothetical protein